jgi:hypothetical protein
MQVATSTETIISDHTVMNAYRSVMAPKKFSRALLAMRSHGNVEFALGIAPMDDLGAVLMGCDDCWREDRHDLGNATFKVQHHLPGCTHCIKHGSVLRRTNVAARASQYAILVSADYATLEPPAHMPAPIGSILKKVSFAISRLHGHTGTSPEPGQLAQFYRMKLRDAGYIDDFDRLRLTLLVDDFTSSYGPVMEFLRIAPPDEADRDNWLARLARAPRGDQSPLKHTLLCLFLGTEPADAVNAAIPLTPYSGRETKKDGGFHRSSRVTDEKVLAKRSELLLLMRSQSGVPIRQSNDALYSWLWRYDRAWLNATLANR